MKIAVLGSGCKKCKKLYDNAIKASEMTSLDVEVFKVESIEKICEYNVLLTPALVIDEVVKSTGKIVSPEQIKKWIEERA